MSYPPPRHHGPRRRRCSCSRPGCTREEYFAELARIGESGRSLTEQEWAELYARHDQVMVDIKAPEDKP